MSARDALQSASVIFQPRFVVVSGQCSGTAGLRLCLSREFLLSFAASARQQFAARDFTLEWPLGLRLFRPPICLSYLCCQGINRAQSLIRVRFTHVDRHAADAIRERFAERQVSGRLLGMDSCDDSAPAGQSMALDFIPGPVSTPYLLNRSRLLVIVRSISISRSLTMSSSLHVTALRDAYQKNLLNRISHALIVPTLACFRHTRNRKVG